MQTDDFEAAFSAFLDRREYDELVQCLFTFVRAAFLAGWKAAGGEAPNRSRPCCCAEKGSSLPKAGKHFRALRLFIDEELTSLLPVL